MASVLIADDALFVRAVLRDILETAGHEIVGCADRSDAAVASFRDLRPDLTILDVNMPGGSGIYALAEIRALDPRARVIVMSVRRSPETRALAIAGGARVVLPKPVEPELLVEAVSAALSEG
jgi:two-component system, chemotaxis family, chemotaxis protein CheY